ncbi:hypothetical protein BBP40_002789 [Aspergillus hancockii]|nr:hypothetical protein BBP40_002789 [Aspergillus hancockii]
MLAVDYLLRPHDALSSHWKNICDRYPPGFIEATASSIVLTLGFLVPAMVYLLLDRYFPTFAKKHKIQQWDKQPSAAEVRHCIMHSLFSYLQTVIGMFAFHWSLDWRYSVYRVDPELPAFSRIIIDFAYSIVCREITFYYIHRLLHHEWFFWIHKKHHEYTTPIGFAAIYCHPIEMLVQNSLPIGLPLAICRGHLLSQLIFAMYAIWDSTAAHSGYDFGRLPSPEMHDKHHETPLLHYGIVGFMDRLHSTDRSPVLKSD